MFKYRSSWTVENGFSPDLFRPVYAPWNSSNKLYGFEYFQSMLSYKKLRYFVLLITGKKIPDHWNVLQLNARLKASQPETFWEWKLVNNQKLLDVVQTSTQNMTKFGIRRGIISYS